MSEAKREIVFDADSFVKEEVGTTTTLLHDRKENPYLTQCGVDEKVVKQLEKFNREYATEFVKDAVSQAADIFDKNKDTDTVKAVVPFGTSEKGSVTVTVKRSVESRVPGTDKVVTSSRVYCDIAEPSHAANGSVVKALKEELTAKFVK